MFTPKWSKAQKPTSLGRTVEKRPGTGGHNDNSNVGNVRYFLATFKDTVDVAILSDSPTSEIKSCAATPRANVKSGDVLPITLLHRPLKEERVISERSLSVAPTSSYEFSTSVRTLPQLSRQRQPVAMRCWNTAASNIHAGTKDGARRKTSWICSGVPSVR